MSHELTTRADGKVEMFSGRNIRPWHGLGTIVEGMLTSKEAIKVANLDWQVELAPVTCNGVVVDDYRAVQRKDNNKVLSIVGTRYAPIQNENSFEFFDNVVGEGQAVFDTAGSLFGGKKVFISAKLPGNLFLNSNKDDTMEKYVLLYTSHDGTSGLTMQIVTIRSVCFNTVSLAMKGATNQIKIRHTASYKDKVGEAQKTLQLIHGYYDDLQGVINTLAETKMTEAEAVKVTETLFPVKPLEEVPTRTLNTRKDILNLFAHGVGNKGETRFDMLNGVTEYCTHERGTRIGDGGNERESKFASLMFGSGAALTQKAFNILTA